MDALRIPAVDRRRTTSDDSRSVGPGIDETQLPSRIKAALVTLLESHEYARDLNADVWDFAVEIARFQSLNLANSDLRWIVARGFVDHAVEVSSVRDKSRTFRHHDRAMFGKRSCFVLTESGIALANELRGEGNTNTDCADLQLVRNSTGNAGEPQQSHEPRWDGHRRELRIASVLVKRFTVPDLDQETVLFAFDEQNWPARIDNPLPDSPLPGSKSTDCTPTDSTPTDGGASPCSKRLQAAVLRLNRGQKQRWIQFHADEEARAVCWEYYRQADEPAEAGPSHANTPG